MLGSGVWPFLACNRSCTYWPITGLGLPNEIWVPATSELPPQQAWQTSTQLRWQGGSGWGFSMEAYYKGMMDLVSFQQGANPPGSFNTGWEALVQGAGRGRSYGTELMLSRHQGRWQGWLAYELAGKRGNSQGSIGKSGTLSDMTAAIR